MVPLTPAAKVGPVTPPPEEKSKDKKPNAKAETSPPPSASEDPPKRTSRPRGRPPELETKLLELFNQVSGAVTLVNAKDGQVIANGAEDLARAWANLARENKNVKAFLDKLTTGGAIGGVVMATGAIVLGILANHGALDALPFFAGANDDEYEIPAPPGFAPQAPPTMGERPPGMGPAAASS